MSKFRRFKKDGKIVPPHRLKLSRKKFNSPQIAAGAETKVRSLYEKSCVEFFEEKNIKFHYEPLIILEGKQYRPDFFLTEHNLFIEICGYTHMPFYNMRTDKKKQIYKRNNLRCLFVIYSGKGSLKKILAEQLLKEGLKF